jgi:uncharacterized coiled-coil DUF342 family protein
MKQIVRTLLAAVFTLVLMVTTIASLYLASGKKKLGEQYAKDRELWTIKNKTLKASIRHSEGEINKLKEDLEKITQALNNSNRELDDLKASYEALKKENLSLSQKIKDYAQEKDSLARKIAQLEKDLKTSEEARKAREAQEEFWSRILREKVDLEFRARDLEEKIRTNRTLLGQLEAERQNLESNLNEVQQAKMVLERKMLEEKKTRSSSSRDTLKVQIEKENIEEELMGLAGKKDELESKMNTLKSQIEEAESQKQTLDSQITRVNQLLEERLSEVNRVREELERALKEAKQIALSGTPPAVELPPIIVKKEGETKTDLSISSSGGVLQQMSAGVNEGFALKKNAAEPYASSVKFIPPKTQRASIVLVNEKHNFVILNIGQKDGVVEGMDFDIYENKERIARVKIKEVRERLSAAQILELARGKKMETESAEAVFSSH